MATGIVTWQRFVRRDHERVPFKADDVLMVRTAVDLLGLQPMLFGSAATVLFDLDRHRATITTLVVGARPLDCYRREGQDGDHRPSS